MERPEMSWQPTVFASKDAELAYWKGLAKGYQGLASYWNNQARNRPSVILAITLAMIAGVGVGMAVATILATTTFLVAGI